MSPTLIRLFAPAGLALGLAALTPAAALAQTGPCPCGSGVRLAAVQIVPMLAGRTVCGRAGNDSWQEFHQGSTAAGGPVIDWKRGPGHATDPTTQVATWSVPATRGEARVVYDYGGGTTFRFAVCDASANAATKTRSTQTGSNAIHLCGEGNTPTNVLSATVRAGQVACN